MNIKDNIIIKDNFFNKDVLKKIHFDISTLKFSNRFKDIDDKNTMHTYIGDLKHITISSVKNDKQANELINELNK